MRSKQLSVLVSAWANRLGREIEVLAEALPGTMPRHSDKRYIGKDFLGPLIDKNPEHWAEIDGSYLALDGLNSFLDELVLAADALRRDEANNDADS